jgi:hypothetical protein
VAGSVSIPEADPAPLMGRPPPPATVTSTLPPTTATRWGVLPIGTRRTLPERVSTRITEPSIGLVTHTAPSDTAASSAESPTRVLSADATGPGSTCQTRPPLSVAHGPSFA